MRTILVVDDEKAMRGVVCASLESKGYRVAAASNMTEGLQISRSQLPDLIISDVIMNNGDGYQLLTALRHEESTANIPFIFMTGDSSGPSLVLGRQLSADALLIKPFALQTLFDTVEIVFRKKDLLPQLSK